MRQSTVGIMTAVALDFLTRRQRSDIKQRGSLNIINSVNIQERCPGARRPRAGTDDRKTYFRFRPANKKMRANSQDFEGSAGG